LDLLKNLDDQSMERVADILQGDAFSQQSSECFKQHIDFENGTKIACKQTSGSKSFSLVPGAMQYA
jgi:hypothetical protein